MTLTISIHSHRGGSGKSVLIANLGIQLANNGYKVAILDLDLRGPSLLYILKEPRIKHFINEYLDGEAEAKDVLVDMSRRLHTKGKLKVAFANPSLEAIKDMMTKTRKWEMNALKRLIELTKELKENKYDFVLIDTPPGLNYSALNAIVSSDAVVLITLPDKVELKGATTLLTEIYDAIKLKVYLIVNKIPVSSGEDAEEIGKEVAAILKKTELLGVIPYYPEVVKYNGDKLMVLDFQHHPYTRAINLIANRLISFQQSS